MIITLSTTTRINTVPLQFLIILQVLLITSDQNKNKSQMSQHSFHSAQGLICVYHTLFINPHTCSTMMDSCRTIHIAINCNIDSADCNINNHNIACIGHSFHLHCNNLMLKEYIANIFPNR